MSHQKKKKKLIKKKELIKNVKNSSTYKSVLEKFPDAELVDLSLLNKDKEND